MSYPHVEALAQAIMSHCRLSVSLVLHSLYKSFRMLNKRIVCDLTGLAYLAQELINKEPVADPTALASRGLAGLFGAQVGSFSALRAQPRAAEPHCIQSEHTWPPQVCSV